MLLLLERFILINKINGFSLALLFSMCLYSNVSYADINTQEEQEALEAIKDATYKQLGIEANVREYLESLIPYKYRKYAEHVVPIAETIHKKRLDLKWEF